MPHFDPKDIQSNSKYASVAYLGVLFFVPLVMCPNSKLGRYCANQGLLVLLAFLAVGLVKSIFSSIPVIGFIISIATTLLNLAIAAIAIYFTYLTYKDGEARELPFIGQISLIK